MPRAYEARNVPSAYQPPDSALAKMFTQLVAALTLASVALASPIANQAQTKRWTQSSANCRSFYANISATAKNLDLGSVIGGPYVKAPLLLRV
jgi:hypothetical protein